MLINEEMFDKVTDLLVERRTIQEFESKKGKLKGRMMITLGELPEDLGIELDPKKKAYVLMVHLISMILLWELLFT
ncbi:DUF3396 domain-containing protein [Enterococcus gallinarum]|uniref:hypothetical protein n=1 Tax=Enterococcus TaxID=1350 RepID=UPI00232C9929|nr:hypothetical protein [Enterococcus gallinarum]MEB6051562.1 DUF3396 domain-containing protein [Enterococcus gallinarum]WCG08705.1 hypothetical protein PML87_14615 [Enterococcus gallinarum]